MNGPFGGPPSWFEALPPHWKTIRELGLKAPPCCKDLAGDLIRRGEYDAFQELAGTDHLCEATMRLACARWLERKVTLENVQPVGLPTGWLWHFYAAGVAVWTAGADQWPHTAGYDADTRLLMVLQQWFEEEPSARLARALPELRRWRAAAAEARQHYDPALPVAFNMRMLRFSLQQHGLPQSLQALEYLKALCAGKEPKAEDMPARGLRVVTLCCVEVHDGHEEPFTVFELAGDSLSGTDSLLEKATETVRRHKEWWLRIRHATEPNLRRHGSRRNEVLQADIERHLAGELTRQELYQRHPEHSASTLRGMIARVRPKK